MIAAGGTPSADMSIARPPVTDAPPPIPAGIVHWYGRATGSWWAMVPGRYEYRLIEAPSEDHLAVAVDWHLRTAAF